MKMLDYRILKKNIDEDAIDGNKIKILDGQALRGTNAAGAAIEILKVQANKLLGLGIELATVPALEAEQSARIAGDEAQAESRRVAVEAEAASRQAADLAEQSARIAGDLEEKTARIAGDSSLQAAIQAEMTARLSAAASEQASRQAADLLEQSARIAADTLLQLYIDELENSLKSQQQMSAQTISDDLSAEVSTRIEEDNLLYEYIDKEITSRVAAVSAEESARIAGDLTEKSRAMAAEAALGIRIDNVLSNIDPTALDSLTEVVAAFQSADGTLNNTISTLASNSSNALNAEITARTSADAAEQSARVAADLSEQSARIAADLAEQSARIAGDSRLENFINVLDSGLGAEIASRQSADSSLQSAINAEQSARVAAVSAEESERIFADTSLQSALNVEKSARIAADSSLQSAISAEVASRVAAVSDEQTARESAVLSEASARVAGDAALQAQIDNLDNGFGALQEVTVYKTSIAINATHVFNGYVDIPYTGSLIRFSAAIDRLNLFETTDYTLTIPLAGTLRVTFTSSFLNGPETIVDGDMMHCEFFLGQYIAAPYDKTFYDDLDNRVATLEGGDTTAGSVAKALKDAKDYTDAQLTAVVGAAPALLNTLSELADAIGDDANFITTVNNKIAAETSSRSAAVSSLQSSVSSLQSQVGSNLQTAISDLQAADAAELTARVAAVSAEAASRQAADSTLQSAISALQSQVGSNLQTAISDLQAADLVEKSARIAADSTLQSAISALESQVGSNLQGAIASLQSVDSSLQSAVNAEVTARSAADATLQAAISSLQSQVGSNLQTAISDLQSADLVEKSARIAADSSLKSAVDAEVTARSAADSSLQTSLNTVSSGLAAEITSRQSADSSLQSAVNAEVTARSGADQTLDAKIGSLSPFVVSTGNSGFTVLPAVYANAAGPLNITEIFIKTTDDLAPTLTINNANGNIDFSKTYIKVGGIKYYAYHAQGTCNVANGTALTLSGNNLIVPNSSSFGLGLVFSNSYNVSFSKNQTNIYDNNDEFGSYYYTSYATSSSIATYSSGLAQASSISEALVTEISARQAADQAEQAARQTADTVLQNNINAEITSRQAAVLAEQTARVAADAATLASAQTYADNKVAALVNSAPAALDTLNELAAALGNDANFSATVLNKFSSETTSRQAAVSGLDTRLSIIEGADTVNGSVAKALKDAKAYTDSYLDTIEALVVSRESDVADSISGFDARLTAIDSSKTASSSSTSGTVFSVDNTVRSFIAQVSVYVAASSKAEMFQLMSVYNGSAWSMSVTSVGDDTGVSFSINSSGVVSFADAAGQNKTIKYKFFTTTV